VFDVKLLPVTMLIPTIYSVHWSLMKCRDYDYLCKYVRN